MSDLKDFRHVYNPADHYWRRENGAIYNSARMAEMLEDDPDYQAFLAQGGRPTPYPKDAAGLESPAELAAVLAPYGLRAYPPTADELAAARIAQIKESLLALDAAKVRPLSALVAGLATEDEKTRLAELNKQTDALRYEMQMTEGAGV